MRVLFTFVVIVTFVLTTILMPNTKPAESWAEVFNDRKMFVIPEDSEDSWDTQVYPDLQIPPEEPLQQDLIVRPRKFFDI